MPPCLKSLGRFVSQADMVLQWVKADRLRTPKHSPSPETMLIHDALKLYDELGVDDCGYAPFVLSIAKRPEPISWRATSGPSAGASEFALQSDFKITLIA